MKKSHIILDVLAAAALAGAYEMFKLAKHRPGLVRWLNYNDNKLREAIPVGTVKYIALAIAVILTILVCKRVFRSSHLSSVLDKIMTVVLAVLTIYYVYATVHFTYDVSKSAFLIVPLVGLADLLLIIRCLIPGKRNKDSQK